MIEAMKKEERGEEKALELDVAGDCMMVKIQGLDACVNCEYFMDEECGGSTSLVMKILENYSVSHYAEWDLNDVLAEDDSLSFMEILDELDFLSKRQLIKPYKRDIKQRSAVAEDEDKGVDVKDVYGYSDVREKGELIDKDGWHNPSAPTIGRGNTKCNCMRTTNKGAYRYEDYKLPDGTIVHYYHQSPVVVEVEEGYIVSSCGYRTSTTKAVIDSNIPFRLYQDDYVWYLDDGEGEPVRFYDGMVISKGAGLSEFRD